MRAVGRHYVLGVHSAYTVVDLFFDVRDPDLRLRLLLFGQHGLPLDLAHRFVKFLVAFLQADVKPGFLISFL